MKLLALLVLMLSSTALAQLPKIEPGVSQELAKWRSVQYSNISYKLDLTLEKMSPVLKGHMEIRVTQAAYACAEPNCPRMAIILDWRKLPGHEKDSTISNVRLNGAASSVPPSLTVGPAQPSTDAQTRGSAGAVPGTQTYEESNDHLIFRDGVKTGENVITLDFTSPILTSGSAITRYIDKEDGSEYIYSLFVPSDASTAFPVFDQPDLKARFSVQLRTPIGWNAVSNTDETEVTRSKCGTELTYDKQSGQAIKTEYKECQETRVFAETKPISTYVFAFAAGDFAVLNEVDHSKEITKFATPRVRKYLLERVPNTVYSGASHDVGTRVFVRKSQAAKFQQHAAETFRLTREAVKYLETYFDYKFPWPKYDLVLIPEFPFGGMEHAGATFLRESAVIFPTEPTKGDEISRANLIFHETAHQWFGDLVTMRWFDDLWLKEGFAEFMAYKTLEHVMPDANAWKVFYERNKQAAYATDSTRGTTPIYQPIANLSAAKSAYGNIVYRKAPSFLRQAEFYFGEEKFQTAVRAFLKKHEYANAGWEDLVGEFQSASGKNLDDWASVWVKQRGAPVIRTRSQNDLFNNAMKLPMVMKEFSTGGGIEQSAVFDQINALGQGRTPREKFRVLRVLENGTTEEATFEPSDTAGKPISLGTGLRTGKPSTAPQMTFEQLMEVARKAKLEADERRKLQVAFIFPNYGDYGYGIFLLDDKSRDYVLKHIGEEKDPFLRSMMWGALWDSVREAELDPREYVELVIKQLGGTASQKPALQKPARSKGTRSADPTLETDETIVASLLGRVSTALNYYLATGALTSVRASATEDLRSRLEAVLLERMQHAETPGQRITFYRAFVSNVSTEKGRGVLKAMLSAGSNVGSGRAKGSPKNVDDSGRGGKMPALQLRTKDRFDIVTRLIILGDPDAPKLLADLEKTETSDDAKRYAYAARAAFPTSENRAKFWNDFVNNKDISESWIEAAIGPFNSIRYPDLSQPYLERALTELPTLKRTRKIFFINNWLSAWLGGQRDKKALDIVNKFLADNPRLDNDLRLKVRENLDVIERAVRIRKRFGGN